MRSYGEISGVQFSRKGWDISALATKYNIWDGDNFRVVHVTTMRELKDEISKFIGDNGSRVDL